MENTIFGIHAGSHHSSITRLDLDTQEIRVFSEERFSKEKAKGGFPINALKVLLKKFPSDQINQDNLFLSYIFEDFDEYIDLLSDENQRFVKSNLPDFNNLKKENYILHHEAHLYSALPYRKKENSIFIIFDGSGSSFTDYERLSRIKANQISAPPGNPNYSYESFSVYKVQNGKISCLEKIFSPTILTGYNQDHCTPTVIYNNVASIFFGHFNHSGKVMGLATSAPMAPTITQDKFIKEVIRYARSGDALRRKEYEKYIPIAQKTQEVFEEWLKDKFIKLSAIEDAEEIFLCGGGALNCTFNGKLEEIITEKNVQFIPFPNDEGVSLGACLFAASEVFKSSQKIQLSPFLGSELAYNEKSWKIYQSNQLIETDVETIVEALLNGGIIISAFGKSECGPRALGNRSILASPFQKNIVDTLNLEIKKREAFRPYGLLIQQEELQKVFQTKLKSSEYMNISLKVKNEYRTKFEEVTHGDGTIRVQTLREDFNQKNLETLLKAFKKATGHGCIINTSLNLAGDPLVEDTNDLLFLLKKVPFSGFVNQNGFYKIK